MWIVTPIYLFCTFIFSYSSQVSGIKHTLSDESLHKSHPLLRSLKKYHVLSVVQFEDFLHERRKREITTEVTNTPGIHHPDTYFVVEYEDKRYTLDLFLNKELLPESFATSYYSDEGELIMHKPTHQEKNHCYYQGNVREVPDSQVIASTCNGLRGTIILPDDVLMIEPLSEDGRLSDYVVYRLQDSKEKSPKTCGNSADNHDHGIHSLLEKFNTYSGTSNATFKRQKRQVGVQRKFVELMIVADNLEAQRYKTRIVLDARIKELANYVDGFYQKLGIRVVLSHVEVWNHTDRVALSNNPETTLDTFLNYRIQRRRSEPVSSAWVYADNVHLLYGGNFIGSTIGMATVGTMCDTRSGGVNEDHSSNVVNTAATVAHEMGHNFGMQHDTRDCVCPQNFQCIMAASSGFNPNRAWSTCSEMFLEQNLKMGLQSCLLNVPDPSRIYGGPQCGNDIVEEGEECDCGEPEFCRSTCCDSRTCKLLDNAVCDGGSCCDNCQFVNAGTECRATENNECELPEFCTGSSPYCPDNVYKQEGTPCLDGSAVCHDGVCLTHTMQCQNIWGQTASNGPDFCYSSVNARGDSNGNCGKDAAGNFIGCTRANQKCGKLLCVGGEDRPLIARDRVTWRNTLGRTTCRTLGSPTEDADVLDPGLVRSGTMCNPGKVCFEGECQDLPSLTCSSRCNGNGICNNLENCHCDDGFAPPFCSQSGAGGSVDSGPMRGGPVRPPIRTTTTRRFVPRTTTTRRPTTTTRRPRTTTRRPRTTTRRTTTRRFFPRPTTTRRTIPRTTTRFPFPFPFPTFFPRPTTTRRVPPSTTTRRFPFFPTAGTPRGFGPTTTSTTTTNKSPIGSTNPPTGSDSDKISNIDQKNTSSPVGIIVAIVLVILLLFVVVGLVVWCRYYGGKSRLDTWRRNRHKEDKPSVHTFQPVATEEETTDAAVRHTVNPIDNRKPKPPISVSRENLLDSNSAVYPPARTHDSHDYYANDDSFDEDEAPANPPPYYAYPPNPPVNPSYSRPTAPQAPVNRPYNQGPPQLPKAKPPILPASKPPLKSSFPPTPSMKPALPPTKPPASSLSPVKPATKPFLPTKPKPSPPKQAVRTAPPPPTANVGAKYSKPSPMVPIKPSSKPSPSPKPMVSNTAGMSVAERARRLNGF